MFYTLIFLCSCLLTYLVKNFAIKKALVAQVNERSSHTVPTPHGGGIAIAFTWFIGITFLYFMNDINESLYFAFMVGIFISIVSYLDDLYELSAKIRLLTQSFVALLGLYFLNGLTQIDLVIITTNNLILTNIFAFFTIIWFINLYNFLDGIDGYAGSQAVFLGVAGFILFNDNYFLVLIASCAGFLVWNWHKAKIFMGDVGSTLLGYNVAVFLIYYQNGSSTNESSSILVWIILFSVFWFDATYTLIRRLLNKEKISLAHKKHAYQRLTQIGWRHDQVVIASLGVNFILLALIIVMKNLLYTFLVSLLLMYILMSCINLKKGFK